jgi:hypothetical protein
MRTPLTSPEPDLSEDLTRLTVHAKELQSGRDLRFDLQIGDFDSSRLREARQTVAGYKIGDLAGAEDYGFPGRRASDMGLILVP